MKDTINFLRDILDDVVEIEDIGFSEKIPMYLIEKYEFRFVNLYNDEKYVLVKPIEKQNININQLLKQMKQIQVYLGRVSIFVFDGLRMSQRKVLIRNRIPFVQPNHQIYIPSVMMCLNQREIVQKEYHEQFSIAAQVVYIHLLLNKIKSTNAPQLAKEIPYSKITCNRALAELVSRGLLYTEGNATRKIYKTIERKELWEKGEKYLFNPVDKIHYATINMSVKNLFISGEIALARLHPAMNECNDISYAASFEKMKWMKLEEPEKFIDKYDTIDKPYLIIEQFKYDPSFLSKTNYIDIISLYAQLREIDDERIQIALEELAEEELWNDWH